MQLKLMLGGIELKKKEKKPTKKTHHKSILKNKNFSWSNYVSWI
jgi:hypothetical protein